MSSLKELVLNPNSQIEKSELWTFTKLKLSIFKGVCVFCVCIDSERSNHSRGKNPERHLPERDLQLPLLFVIAIIPLNHVLRKCKGGYTFSKSQETMCMDDIKVFAKKWKRTGDPDAYYKYIEPQFGIGIWDWKMCHDDNEKWKKRSNGINRTAKPESNQNSWREGKTTWEY